MPRVVRRAFKIVLSVITDYLQTPVRCRRRSAGCSRRYRHPHPALRPQKYRPSAFLLCMVLGSTSRTDTPPLVITAWARSPRASMDTRQCFISCTSSLFCSRVIWFALVAGSTAPARHHHRLHTGRQNALPAAPLRRMVCQQGKIPRDAVIKLLLAESGLEVDLRMILVFFSCRPDGWMRSKSAGR